MSRAPASGPSSGWRSASSSRAPPSPRASRTHRPSPAPTDRSTPASRSTAARSSAPPPSSVGTVNGSAVDVSNVFVTPSTMPPFSSSLWRITFSSSSALGLVVDRRRAAPAIVREDQRGHHLLLAVRVVAGLGRPSVCRSGTGSSRAPAPFSAFEDAAREGPQPIELLALVELARRSSSRGPSPRCGSPCCGGCPGCSPGRLRPGNRSPGCPGRRGKAA